MNCIIHQEKEAAGICTYCGKFFCQDCLVDIKGRNYCREHVINAIDEQSHAASANNASASNAAGQPNIIINNANANTNTNTNTVGNGYGIAVSPKSRLVSFLLCIFLGGLGIHRFYVGKVGTGILYLFTLGFFGIGAFVDFILILVGSFRDSYGMIVKNW